MLRCMNNTEPVRNTERAAADLLNDRVLPFFEEHPGSRAVPRWAQFFKISFDRRLLSFDPARFPEGLCSRFRQSA
jgi:hypothetical protein